MLENISPQQKQLLMIGAPIVAVFAFVSSRKGGSGTTSGPQVVGAQAGVDAGQLGEFLNTVNAQVVGGFDRLQAEVDATEEQLKAANNAALISQSDALVAVNTKFATLSDQINSMKNAAPSFTPPPPTPPAPPVAPNQAVIVANPIQGDNTVYVEGRTPDGYSYSYGGSQDQANLLVNNSPTPAPAVKFNKLAAVRR
jgi:hypothetical protein